MTTAAAIVAAVSTVDCPKCHAIAGQPCHEFTEGRRVVLTVRHLERYEATQATLDAKLPGAVRLTATFTYVPGVSTGDEMADLVAERLAAVETARRARFEKARTNTERLMELGVIITCDDERDAYYIGKHRSEQAKLAGVTERLYTRADEFARIAEGIVDEARRIASQNETDEEHSARVEEAAAKSEHPVAPGMKKPCRHNATKTARGLTFAGERDGKERWICARCKTEFTIPAKPALPTAAAQQAATLVARFGR